jgi:hypothetical protein
MFGRAGFITAAAALTIAAPAHAARAYVNYDSLVVSAGPGEVNVVDIRPDPAAPASGGPGFLITDPGASMAAGPGCTRAGFGHAIRCQLSADNRVASLSLYLGDRGDQATVDGTFFLFQVDAGAGNDRLDLVGGQAISRYSGPYTHVSLGAGNDTLQLQESFDGTVEVYGEGGADEIAAGGYVDGGDGNDELTGSYMADWLYGGAGDDTIDSDDAYYDHVDCGAGADSSLADEADDIEGCETVTRCPVLGAEPQLPRPDCAAGEAREFLP